MRLLLILFNKCYQMNWFCFRGLTILSFINLSNSDLFLNNSLTVSATSVPCSTDTCINGECVKLPDQLEEEYECSCDRGWDGDRCDQKLPVNEVFFKKPVARDEEPTSTVATKLFSKDKIRFYVTLVLVVMMGAALAVSTFMLWKKSQRSYRPPVEFEHRPSRGKVVAHSVASPSLSAHQQTV